MNLPRLFGNSQFSLSRLKHKSHRQTTASSNAIVDNLPIYFPLDTTGRQIRILTLHPSQERQSSIYISTNSVSLDSNPKYQALSYCWGSDNLTSSVSNNWQKQYVTPNLESALRSLRHPKRKIALWIDAVCINQNDVEERNQQLKLMAEIYKNAETVLVWLGGADDDSDLAMETAERWARDHPYRPEGGSTISNDLLTELRQNTFNAKAWIAIYNLLGRPYWTRTWIFQEIMLGRNVVVRCGHKQIDWSCIEGLDETFYQIRRKFELFKSELPADRVAIIEKVWRNGIMLAPFVGNSSVKIQQGLVFDVMLQTADFSCKDPRDRLYAILGLVQDAEDYPTPDYACSVAQLYTDIACSRIVQSQTLDILHESACRPALDMTYESGPAMPSWVPKWTIIPQHRVPSYGFIKYFNAARAIPFDSTSTISQNRYQLEASGVHCDRIARVASSSLLELGLPESLAFIENANHKFDNRDYRELKGYNHIYPTGEPLLFALFRTCLLDIDTRLGTSRLQMTELLTLTFQLAQGFLMRLGSDYGMFLRTPSTLEELYDLKIPPFELDFDFLPTELVNEKPQLATFGTYKTYLESSPSMTETFLSIFDVQMEIMSHNRTLFITEKGYIGLSTNSLLEPGDDLTVLFGCQTPVILRQVIEADNVCHRFVSDCFVHGFMDGEAVKDVSTKHEDGKYSYCMDTREEKGLEIKQFIIR